MATAREKNGRWYFRITLSTNGRNKYLERGSFDSKEEAIQAGTEYEKKVKADRDRSFVPVNITYGDMASEWITTYAPAVYKQGTITTHKKTLKNYILPVLKDCSVSSITTRMLQEIINQETSQHTRYGLDKIHSTLAKSFDYAIIQGYISKTPVYGVTMPKIRSVMAKEIHPTREQKACPKRLVNAIFDRFPEGHSAYIPLLLAYRCGLRLGEAYGLLIEDIDRVNRKIYVRRQIQFNEENELYFTEPKYCNPGEYRVIDLDKNTWKILLKHIQKIESCRSVMHHKQYYITKNGFLSETNGEPIFLLNVRIADGSYISPRTMQHVGRVIHGKTGVFDAVDPDWDYHMLRHTHASDCIAAGMAPETVRKRLGHRRLSTTYKFYVHETESQSEAAKAILEEMYS